MNRKTTPSDSRLTVGQALVEAFDMFEGRLQSWANGEAAIGFSEEPKEAGAANKRARDEDSSVKKENDALKIQNAKLQMDLKAAQGRVNGGGKKKKKQPKAKAPAKK